MKRWSQKRLGVYFLELFSIYFLIGKDAPKRVIKSNAKWNARRVRPVREKVNTGMSRLDLDITTTVKRKTKPTVKVLFMQPTITGWRQISQLCINPQKLNELLSQTSTCNRIVCPNVSVALWPYSIHLWVTLSGFQLPIFVSLTKDLALAAEQWVTH